MAYLYMIHATPAALISWHCRVAKVVLGKMAIKNARHRVGGGRPSMPCPGIFHFSLTTAAGLSFHWRQSRVAFEAILWNKAAAATGNTPSWNFCKRSLSIVLFGRVLQYCVPVEEGNLIWTPPCCCCFCPRRILFTSDNTSEFRIPSWFVHCREDSSVILQRNLIWTPPCPQASWLHLPDYWSSVQW